MNNTHLRIIGDIHGNVSNLPTRPLNPACKDRTYMSLIKDVEYSVQIGDMGYGESVDILRKNDNPNHKVVLGNHDDYYNPIPQSLGDYGYTQVGGMYFFFVRGASSIDKQYRTLGIDWWPNEELDFSQASKCITMYEATKPDVVITHTAPEFLIDLILAPGNNYRDMSCRLLQRLWEIHKPKLWIFGHWHHNLNQLVGNCRFVCLNELNYLDFDNQGISDWEIK